MPLYRLIFTFFCFFIFKASNIWKEQNEPDWMKLKVHSVVCCSNVADACGESKADAPTRAYMIIGGQLLGNSSPHLPSGCDELCASRSRRILKWRHDPANISTPLHHFPSRSASTKIGCGMISKSKSAGGWGTRSQAQHFFLFFLFCLFWCLQTCLLCSPSSKLQNISRMFFLIQTVQKNVNSSPILPWKAFLLLVFRYLHFFFFTFTMTTFVSIVFPWKLEPWMF